MNNVKEKKDSVIVKGGHNTSETSTQEIQAFMPRVGKNEVGVEGEMLVSSYYNEENRVDDLSFKDYRRMKDNDGEIQMLLNAIVNSIISPGYKILDDNDYLKENDGKEDVEDSEEKKFVEQNLSNPRWKNGMSRSMEITNRTNLRALEEGHITYEVVYRVDEDGKVRLDKLAPRVARNSDYDCRIITDNNGNFFGFHQVAYFKSESTDVIIINETGINRALNVAYGTEYGTNYGRSAFKSAYYHFDKLHKLLYIMHKGVELGSVKLRSIKKIATAGNPEDDTLFDVMQKAVDASVVMYDGNKYEVTFEDVTDANALAQGMVMVNYHTTQMAKSLLAQFIEMGTQGNTGNRALGDTGKDFFKNGLQAMARILIDDPWNKVIADIVKINFDSGVYPTYITNPISDDTAGVLYEAFQGLITSGKVPDSLVAEIYEKTGNKLGIDVDDEALLEEMQKAKEEEAKVQQDQFAMKVQSMKQNAQKPIGKKKPANLADDMEVNMDMVMTPSEQTINRPLYPDEQKVNLLDIKRKLDSTRNSAENILSLKLSYQRDQIIGQYLQAFKSGNKILPEVDIALADLPSQSSYSSELLNIALELFEYGKLEAARELNKSVPVTPKATRDLIVNKVKRIIKKQESDLEFQLYDIAQRSLTTGIPENDARLTLDNEYSSFIDKKVSPTLAALIPETFTAGRQVVFDKYQSSIYAYRYTAVLDAHTTKTCRGLDGKVFQPNDPDYSMLTPPNHYGCRSIWTPITNEEAKAGNIFVTGNNIGAPVYTSINSFVDTSEEDKLAIKLEEKKRLELVNTELKQVIKKQALDRNTKENEELDKLINETLENIKMIQ